MKTEKTTAELINTGYWLALQTGEPIEVIEILFLDVNVRCIVEELNDLLEELNLKIQDLYTDIDELLNQ